MYMYICEPCFVGPSTCIFLIGKYFKSAWYKLVSVLCLQVQEDIISRLVREQDNCMEDSESYCLTEWLGGVHVINLCH